jgi:hypothetical protein
VAAIKAVKEPMIVIINKLKLEYSNIGEERNITKTPAVTIVAACIKAETGVGPSIASGNQVCKPNCADLPTAPINNNKDIQVILSTDNPKNIKLSLKKRGTVLKIIAKSKEEKTENIRAIPKDKPKSPILFTIIAFMAALFA